MVTDKLVKCTTDLINEYDIIDEDLKQDIYLYALLNADNIDSPNSIKRIINNMIGNSNEIPYECRNPNHLINLINSMDKIQTEFRLEIESKIQMLSAIKHDIIKYIYFDEMDLEEISKILNISISEINNLETEALIELKSLL